MMNTVASPEELAESFQGLKLSIERRCSPTIDSLLKSLENSDDKPRFFESVVDNELLASFTKILQNGSIKDKSRVAEFIAELEKIEECRLSSIFKGVVPLLAELLDSDDLNANLQACRSLGNMCYEHDGGRMSVTACGALKKLLSLMQRILKYPKNQETRMLKMTATGFLLNIMNSYGIVKQHSEHLDIVEVLGAYLHECIDENDIMSHIMLSLSCIAEERDECEVIVNNFTSSLIRVVYKTSSLDVLESCLELLYEIAQYDGFKTKLAERGTAEAAIDVIRKYNSKTDEISQNISRIASDIIVVILIGNEGMAVLYDNGNGTVYKSLLEWLTSDIDGLITTGALAVGNFAGSDENCKQMVDQGIGRIICRILERNSTRTADPRLTHHLLCALRNLAIPKVNKPILISQGCLDVLIPMIKTADVDPVVFKLLGTLRMLVDGQPQLAAILSGSQEILERLVGWTSLPYAPLVTAEASRILAWVIRSSEQQSYLFKAYKRTGALKPLILMLTTNQILMLLEATFSLKTLLAGNVDKEVIEVLRDNSFIEKCVILMKNLNGQLISDILSLLQTISQTDCGLSYLKNDDLINSLEEWFATRFDSSLCPDKNLLELIKA